MSNATLPPELHQIARDAARNGRRPAPPRTATILGLGHYLPSEVVPNADIAERIGVDDHWIVKRTGIKARRRAAANEGTTSAALFTALLPHAARVERFAAVVDASADGRLR